MVSRNGEEEANSHSDSDSFDFMEEFYLRHGFICPAEAMNPSLSFLEPISTHQSLDATFTRLNLSTTPPHQSPSLPSALLCFDRVISRPVIRNSNVDHSMLCQHYQTGTQLQQEINHLDPFMRQIVASNEAHGSASVVSRGFDMPQLNPSPVLDDQREFFNQAGGALHVHDDPYSMYSLDWGYSMSPFDDHHLYQLQKHPKYSSLEELRGRIAVVAKSQHGCNFLKKKVDERREEEIRMIFLEVIDRISELMMDLFGSKFVENLLDVCNEEQRNQVLLSVTRHRYDFVNICLDVHGTRAMQKLLQYLTTQQQISRVIWALELDTVRLANNQNGQHIIQLCLRQFSNEDNKYLLSAIADNCITIGTDLSGSCVLQQCLHHAHGEPRDLLVAEIASNALVLAQDRHGNYVVQLVLELRIPDATAAILQLFKGSFVSLSKQKFSSNVVETCLKVLRKEQSAWIINELIRSPDFFMLLKDPFGNFVVQSALVASFKDPLFYDIVNLVRTHSRSLCGNPYGKRIVEKIRELNSPQYANMYSVRGSFRNKFHM